MRRLAWAGAVVASVLLTSQGRPAAQQPLFDLVIQGGRVVDGSGNPWTAADIGIRGDAIVAIESQLDASGSRVPRRLFVAPVDVAVSPYRRRYAVSSDASRFLINEKQDTGAGAITVVLNWTELLKK